MSAGLGQLWTNCICQFRNGGELHVIDPMFFSSTSRTGTETKIAAHKCCRQRVLRWHCVEIQVRENSLAIIKNVHREICSYNNQCLRVPFVSIQRGKLFRREQ